jgi:hypothetical protein
VLNNINTKYRSYVVVVVSQSKNLHSLTIEHKDYVYFVFPFKKIKLFSVNIIIKIVIRSPIIKVSLMKEKAKAKKEDIN